MEILRKYIKFKNSQIDETKNKNFESLFNLIHDQDDRIFCEYMDGFKKKCVSYKECKSYCFKMGSYLKSQIKTPTGCFVGILMENSIDWVGCFWGLLMIGYKPVLLNAKLPTVINARILELLKVKDVVCSKEFANNELKANSIIVDRANIKKLNPLSKTNWENEIAMCTTASSLNFKVCVYSGENMYHQLANAKDVISWYCPRVKKHYKHRLKLLSFLPLYHVFGLIATYLWFSLYGRTLVFLKDYSADTILSTIKDFEITHIFAVPLFWNTIAKQINREINKLDDKAKKKIKKAQNFSLSLQNLNWKFGSWFAKRLFKQITQKTLGYSVNFIISGGSYQSDETMRLFNSLGYPLLIGYGMSEIGIICFEARNKPKDRLLGTCGRPLKSVEVKVQNNVLWVKGKSTCKYFYYKDGTRVDLNGDWFNTNDIASIDNKGYISILGRDDDVIVCDNGEKINPDLIEKKFNFLHIPNFVIVPINGKTSLIVQFPLHSSKTEIELIKKEIKENVESVLKDGYSINYIYVTTDALSPKNAIKVSRRLLKQRLENNQIKLIPLSKFNESKYSTLVKVDQEILKEVKDIIEDTLNKKNINPNQHIIFDLGGTSLDYITILMRLENKFNIKIKFNDSSYMTVNKLASYIESITKEGKQ